MLIAKIPGNNADYSEASSCVDDRPIKQAAKKYGVDDLGVLHGTPIENLRRPKGFNASIMRAVFDALSDDQKEKTSLRTLTYAGDLDGSLLGCYAAAPHDDKGVAAFNIRWLIVLQCLPGFTLKAQNTKRRFEMEVQPGMVIEFDEDEEHELDFSGPDNVDESIPNLFYSIPAPQQIRD